jgi:hypothetical protein
MRAERKDQILGLRLLDAIIPLDEVSLDAAAEEHTLPTVDVSSKLGW